MEKPTALLTNDDGIDCLFLKVLADVIAMDFDVIVAAPKREQSWIGKSISRHHSVQVERSDLFDCMAWSIDGTPSDCINIALANLLDKKPDVVVSGINIGYNMTVPLIMSSGTVAGALEGACWGIPALAVSQRLPYNLFDRVKKMDVSESGELPTILKISAGHACKIAKSIVGTPNNDISVHNLNCPYPIDEKTLVERTIPDLGHIGGFFNHSGNGTYDFEFHEWEQPPMAANTDRECLTRGNISHSTLVYSRIGMQVKI